MKTRMNRSKLNIGAYYLRPYACTEEHIKEVRECGIDFIVDVPYDKKMLDLFAKYDLGAIIEGYIPRWINGDGTQAGKMREIHPLRVYQEAAKEYIDHPAIWSMDICDEPSAKEFPYLHEVIEVVGEGFPNQFVYLNIYPSYAQVAANSLDTTISQLGTRTYAEHIEEYCKNIQLDYLCYDFYMYTAGQIKAYENLEIVAEACLKTGREMWIVLQVNSFKPEVWISENQLRMQAYSAMAFGVKQIIWACYTAGWWHNQVLDKTGNKTQQYEKLKTVNHEIKCIDDEYSKYRYRSTQFIGFKETDKDVSKIKNKPIAHFSNDFFTDVYTNDGKFIVGEMVEEHNDGYALFVCAADDYKDENPKTTSLYIKASGKPLVALNGKGEMPLKQENGYYVLTMQSCQGALVYSK